MTRYFIAICLIACTLELCCAAPITLHIDNTHSSIQFSAQFLVISEVPGRFEKFCGQFYFDETNMAVSRLELYIDASSINTSLKIRDRDLVEKYLETQKFPIIYYKSKSVRQVKPNQFEVIGDFSLHGVTKELRITLTTIGDIINDEKARELGLKLQPLKINRRDYGIMEGAVGSATVGDTVTVSAVIRLRDVTPYRKDIDVRYPETPASARASLTTPFIGWYVSSRGARIDLISDGSNYFVSFSDDNWSWLAQAKMVGPNQFKLMSFSNLVELTSVGLTYTKPGAQPEPFTRVVKN